MPTTTIPFDICNRWTGEVQFTAQIECSADALPAVKLGLAVRWAVLDGASLVGASLDGASLDGASLVGARLVGASLVGASLDGARLDGARLVGASLVGASLVGARLSESAIRSFKADLWLTLSQARDLTEVQFLVTALRAGAVDGRTYGDGRSCACLVGTMARLHGERGEARDHGASRPAEQWFMMIKPGDVPGIAGEGETGGSFAARLALEWTLEWCACHGVDPDGLPGAKALLANEAVATQ